MGGKLARARAQYTDLPRVTSLCLLTSLGARVYNREETSPQKTQGSCPIAYETTRHRKLKATAAFNFT